MHSSMVVNVVNPDLFSNKNLLRIITKYYVLSFNISKNESRLVGNSHMIWFILDRINFTDRWRFVVTTCLIYLLREKTTNHSSSKNKMTTKIEQPANIQIFEIMHAMVRKLMLFEKQDQFASYYSKTTYISIPRASQWYFIWKPSATVWLISHGDN